jgi:hypothetical protein
MYTETSAKTNHNVKIAIERVINEIYETVSGSSSLSRDTSFDTQKKKERSISYKFQDSSLSGKAGNSQNVSLAENGVHSGVILEPSSKKSKKCC